MTDSFNVSRRAQTSVRMSWPAKAFVVLCWSTVLLALPRLYEGVRATFDTDTTPFPAKAVLVPKTGSGQAVRLDTLSGLVLVYNAQCTACTSNTDNWVRLVADLRVRAPNVPIYLVAAPHDSMGRTSISPWLSGVFPEYLLPSAVVDSALGVTLLPATVVVERGSVVRRATGILGPKRREAILLAFAPGRSGQ